MGSSFRFAEEEDMRYQLQIEQQREEQIQSYEDATSEELLAIFYHFKEKDRIRKKIQRELGRVYTSPGPCTVEFKLQALVDILTRRGGLPL